VSERRHRGGSTWEVARVPRRCRWCEESVVVGSLVLLVGVRRLVCCRLCAHRYRGLVPAAELIASAVAKDTDARLRGLPEQDR
jgi:hypothetical protein